MTSASPEYGAPNGQPWQPGPPVPPQQPPIPPQPPYQQAPQPPYQQAPQPPQQPARASGYVLHRWPRWAQNTAVIVGAVAVLVIVFFAGFFTANAVDHGRTGFGTGTGQNFVPRQFGNGNGFGQNGGQSGSGQSGSGQSGSGQSGNGQSGSGQSGSGQ